MVIKYAKCRTDFSDQFRNINNTSKNVFALI